MLQIFDSLKTLVSPEVLSKASVVLGDDTSKVSTASNSIIAGFLAALLHKGDTTQLKDILTEAGKSNLLSDITGIFSDNGSVKQKALGDRLTTALFGSKTDNFLSVIASHTGISHSSVSKLTAMISPVIAGFLGNKLVSNGFNLSGLLSQIDDERSSFTSYLPKGFANVLGLSSLSDLNYKRTGRVTDTTKTVYTKPEEKKRGMGWLTWLILLGLILLAFFWWRSCRNHTDTDYVSNYTDTTTVVDRTANRIDTLQNKVTNNDYTLPNGVTFSSRLSGTEDRMLSYLKSDDWKNISSDSTKWKTFEFDDIAFQVGSSTDFTNGSRAQLDNVIQILKAYPDARFRIAGYADKTGTQEVNLPLSKARAETIRKMFESQGLGSQIAGTVGYGETYAKHNASASADARAEDRNIAIQFVK